MSTNLRQKGETVTAIRGDRFSGNGHRSLTSSSSWLEPPEETRFGLPGACAQYRSHNPTVSRHGEFREMQIRKRATVPPSHPIS